MKALTAWCRDGGGGNMVKMEARVFGCVEMNRNIRGVDKVFVRPIWKYGSAYVI